MAVFVYAPYGMPLDHPDLEPIWAAAWYDLSVLMHTFTVAPPYAPGGLDTWDNLWLQRSASHPWCATRNMASVIASGVMDRYPDLRVGVLEAGHGWLPFWVKALDEHQTSVLTALPALKHTPSEYVSSGRYFQSIEMSEGQEVTKKRHRHPGRGNSHVRLRLSPRRKLVPHFGGHGHGVGRHSGERKEKAILGQRSAVLPDVRSWVGCQRVGSLPPANRRLLLAFRVSMMYRLFRSQSVREGRRYSHEMPSPAC